MRFGKLLEISLKESLQFLGSPITLIGGGGGSVGIEFLEQILENGYTDIEINIHKHFTVELLKQIIITTVGIL